MRYTLGRGYRRRFGLGGMVADLDKAIELAEHVVAAVPDDHPDRPWYLSELGVGYRDRYGHSEGAGDLDGAGERDV